MPQELTVSKYALANFNKNYEFWAKFRKQVFAMENGSLKNNLQIIMTYGGLYVLDEHFQELRGFIRSLGPVRGAVRFISREEADRQRDEYLSKLAK